MLRSIVVIEHEPESLKLLLTILIEHGYRVNPATDGQSGLRLVKSILPDLVLVEVSIPGVDGYQLCGSLKNDPATRPIPVILISSIDRSIHQAKALVSGAVDYITKPFDAEEVLWRIQTHISLRRLRHNLESKVSKGTSHELETALQEIQILTQVTGRKHAEEKIREQEAELRQVLDLAPQHIVVLDPDGSRLYSNQAALDYYGFTLAEWRSCDPRRLFHPDDCERMTNEAQIRVLSSFPHEAEARLLGRDGKYRWFLFRHNPLRDGQGHTKRWYVAAFDIEDHKRTQERLQYEKDRLQDENLALREQIDHSFMFEEIVGTSRALQAVLARVAKVAPTDSTVLITGETGTGKELIARAIHKRSRRSGRAFVSVNCAALAPSLISSELFGHEKGAFTGATQRRLGRFELADGGTIFLDELGELPPDVQVALLRVLQEREFERVGGAHSIKIDVRLIAATNRDLEGATANGTFRLDLFYRVNVFPIEVPPLRERKDDILILLEYLVKRYARRAGKNIRSIAGKTLELFQSYDWPGNIRELQNVVERSVILTSGDVFSVDESWLSRKSSQASPRIQASPSFGNEQREEREIIEAALAESRGRVAGRTGAAARLGIPPSTLEYKIKTLKIPKSQFKFR